MRSFGNADRVGRYGRLGKVEERQNGRKKEIRAREGRKKGSCTYIYSSTFKWCLIVRQVGEPGALLLYNHITSHHARSEKVTSTSKSKPACIDRQHCRRLVIIKDPHPSTSTNWIRDRDFCLVIFWPVLVSQNPHASQVQTQDTLSQGVSTVLLHRTFISKSILSTDKSACRLPSIQRANVRVYVTYVNPNALSPIQLPPSSHHIIKAANNPSSIFHPSSERARGILA